MAKLKKESATVVTSQRAGRLFRLLNLIGEAPRKRSVLLRKLKVDRRGFYRDLEFLRSLNVEITSDGDTYTLVGTVEDALIHLPFPDPGLSFQDVLMLASGGRSAAHRKLKSRLDIFTGPSVVGGR